MDTVQEISQVAEFYHDRCVLVTGATGFIGKVLVEKLLYSCTSIKNIYVLIRPKTPVQNLGNCQDRFEKLLESEAFARLKQERPNDLKKIIPVWGDVSQTNLGISTDVERKLIDEVTVVFHGAATVKFNEPLKILKLIDVGDMDFLVKYFSCLKYRVAVEVNLIGVKNVLEFFKKLKNPQSLVYISTAFANCHRKVIEESIYPIAVDPDFLLEANAKFDQKAMDCLTEGISEGRPNTYTITKAAAENYLEQHAGDLPITIVRPSIVENSYKEPSVGWRDSHSILSRCIYVIGLGLIHNLPVESRNRMDVVPLDFVVNLIIVVAWNTAIKINRGNKLPVYNMVSCNRNPIIYQHFMKQCVAHGLLEPSSRSLNHVYVTFTTNKLYLFYGKYFEHYLPAAVIDFVLLFTGQKPKYLNMYRRFFSTLPLQTFFMQNHFDFKSGNVDNLFKDLSPSDQKIFNFDVASFKWPEYIAIMLEGLRRFIVPDDCKIDLKVRRQVMKRNYRRFILMRVGLVSAFLYLAYLLFF